MKVFITIFGLLLGLILSKECKDDNFVKCLKYKHFGWCEEMAGMMAHKCPFTCRVCTAEVPDTGNSTSDGVPCGIAVSLGRRIIGGKVAQKGAWPWQASIYYNGKFICGGSVISKKWILTAAHCVEGSDTSKFDIVLGDHDRDDVDNNEQIFTARQAFHHPHWSMKEFNNDVALIELSSPAVMTNYLRPICLPETQEHLQDGSICTITGWGQTKMGRRGPLSSVLKQVHLSTVSRDTCAMLNTAKLHLNITENMLCAGSGGKDWDSICHGDSGGPFVCRGKKDQWVLQGVVSWGSTICNSHAGYAVFAKVITYLDWIKTYVQ